MKHLLSALISVAVLTFAACGGDAESEVEPPQTVPIDEPTTTAATPSTTPAAGELPMGRAEAEAEVAARLEADAPGSVTDEQIDCVAAATVGAFDDERLPDVVAALAEPSYAVLPADAVSAAERDRIVDAAAGCLPWTQTILDSLQDAPDVPPRRNRVRAGSGHQRRDRPACRRHRPVRRGSRTCSQPTVASRLSAADRRGPSRNSGGQAHSSPAGLGGGLTRKRRVRSGTSRRPQRDASRPKRH